MKLLNLMKKIILSLVLTFFSAPVIAAKPKWVGNTPKELNNTYRFVEVVSYGNNIQGAREDATLQLAKNEQLQRAVRVNVESGLLTNINQTNNNGNLVEAIRKEVNTKMTVSGEEYRLQAYPIDEYIAQNSHGNVVLHTLFMVAVTDNPAFDRTYISTSYGAGPVFMSIVPGIGQMYKGSTVKGVCMLAGVAACSIGALFCENERSDYKNKMREQPEFAYSYNNKSKNWETARNICVGAAVAVYLYNLIDAAAAKGARRVIVKGANGGGVAVNPMATFDGAGITLTYNF